MWAWDSLSLYVCTANTAAEREKNPSQLRPPQSTGKSSPYTWQVLAAMQIKPQSFKDKLSWAFMFVSITAPLLLLAQEVAFSFPLSTMHPASCLFSVIFLCFAAPRQENRHVFTNKSHNISLQWALISWESGCMYAGGELDGRVEKPEGQSGLQGWRTGWPLDTKCRQAFFFFKDKQPLLSHWWIMQHLSEPDGTVSTQTPSLSPTHCS